MGEGLYGGVALLPLYPLLIYANKLYIHLYGAMFDFADVTRSGILGWSLRGGLRFGWGCAARF